MEVRVGDMELKGDTEIEYPMRWGERTVVRIECRRESMCVPDIQGAAEHTRKDSLGKWALLFIRDKTAASKAY